VRITPAARSRVLMSPSRNEWGAPSLAPFEGGFRRTTVVGRLETHYRDALARPEGVHREGR